MCEGIADSPSMPSAPQSFCVQHRWARGLENARQGRVSVSIEREGWLEMKRDGECKCRVRGVVGGERGGGR